MVRAILLIAALVSAGRADPVDVATDFLVSLRDADGYSMLEIFSGSLRESFDSQYRQLVELASEDPEAARVVLARILPGIAPSDVAGMSAGGLLSLLLLQMDPSAFPPFTQTGESMELRGRSAFVTFSWEGTGATASFDLVWERGDWRINGSSVIHYMFERM
jgi:hypothetical protein